MTKIYDALIIGGGHNGLVCAFYLAKAGMRVRVLERRHVVGGAAVTEEFHPGFRNSVASYTVSLLQPKVIADMRLAERGLRMRDQQATEAYGFRDGFQPHTIGHRAAFGELEQGGHSRGGAG